MAPTVSFPSAAFPAYPSVALDVPDDWEPLNAQGSLIAVAQRVEAGQFRPNVVVAISRFTGDYQLATAIEAVVRKFGEQKDISEIGREERTVLGVPGFRMEVSFSDERVGTLVQAIHLAVVRQGGVADLVQITGSCSASQAREIWPVVRSVLESATGGAA